MMTTPRTGTPGWRRRRSLVLPTLLALLLWAPSALAVGNPPVNTERPAISGSARYGQTLTGTQGVWTGTEPITYADQWRRCDVDGNNCADIPSATGLTYTLGAADIGARVTIRVTASNAYGTASSRSWLSGSVVSAPVNTVLPSLSGTARRGETLTVATGTWIGTPQITYAYQWRRCDSDGNNCTDIAAATGSSYLLVSADVGNRVHARVTATNGYGSALKRSWNSAVVVGTGGGDSGRFGISGMTATLSYEPTVDFQRDMDAIAASGAGWLRIDINWAVIQRQGPTSYDWAPFDRIVQGARARGMNVLGIIAWTPKWARPSPDDEFTTPPKNISDYASFANAAVKRYSAMGVHAYEVWNEPNITGFWKPAPDPLRYVELLKAGYSAIRQADPSATVVSGGLSPAANAGGDIDPRTFLQAMYANGAKGYFDALGHHPYCFPAAPGDPQNWSAWYQMYGTSTSLRSTMVANGDGDKKIWATEFGAPTNGPSGAYVSETTQAQHVTKAYELFGSYSWAGPLFTYSSRDYGTNPNTNYNFWGLLRYDFSSKPAFAAYQAAVAAD